MDYIQVNAVDQKSTNRTIHSPHLSPAAAAAAAGGDGVTSRMTSC